MRFQKSQPTGAATLVPPSASTGPLISMDASPPHKKRTPTKFTKKLAAFRNTCELPWPVRDNMKKRLSTKPVWGRTAPVCRVELSGCASS
jgi:hypothetical protein